MSRYTYILNPTYEEMENDTYKQSKLEKMTTFHLREICRCLSYNWDKLEETQ